MKKHFLKCLILFQLLTIFASNAEAQNIYYIRQQDPWGVDLSSYLSQAFGAGNYTISDYSISPATLFTGTTSIIYFEGSDGYSFGTNGNPTMLNNFLNANRTALESWVNNGGVLFLNAAPNQGGNINFGFGGVTLNFTGVTYPYASSNVSITSGQATHPIFNTPNAGVGSAWSGGYFSHATVSGGGITSLITGNILGGGTGIALAELKYGNGLVLFGGMTTPNFHSPQPQANNLFVNILSYLKTFIGNVINTSSISGPFCPGTNLNINYTANGIYNNSNSFTAQLSDASGSFASPVNIGNVTATTSGSITATIPANVIYGTGYRIRVVSDNPVVTGIDNGTNLIIGDNQKPTVITQNITVQLDASDAATIIPAQINNGSTDNCTAAANLILALDKTTFDCSNIGGNTVTLTITDANGNAQTGTATVTVEDKIKPTVVTQNITVQLDANGAATITPAQINNGSTDNCSIPANGYSLDKSSFDCSSVGANTVTLTVTDVNGNSQTGTATVTVQDNIKPTVVTQNVTVQLDATGHASVTPAQINNVSTDNCSIPANGYSLDKSSFDCNNVGANTVILTVTDANGNIQTGTATVTVQDNIKPTVVTQNVTVQLDATGHASVTPTQINNVSTDNCSIPANGYSLDKSSFDCSNVGANTVTLTVTDVNGNAQTGTATVTVQDKINPVASCKSIDVYLGMNGTVTITPQDVDNGSSDNCGVSLSIDKNSFNTSNVGPNNVILTATDPSGNHSSCTAVVTVKQRPTTLTYTGDGSEQYSDQQLLTAVLTDQLTGTVLSGETINFTIGSQSASGSTNASGIASTNLILTQDPALSYTVASSFAGDAIYLPASDNDPFDILREDARAYYTGALFASTSGSTSSSAVVTLSATIKDITAVTGDPAYDPFPGDIRNATVSFINRDNNNAVIATVPVGLVNSGDLLTGTATYNWSTDIGSADSKQFTIGIRVNNYYTRDVSDENTVVTVSKPLNNFITGGGYIVLQNSSGLKAGKPGTKNNFGFNVKYNKSGTNLQGNINAIYRRMENDGLLHVYQIKGNAMTSLAIDGSKTTKHPYPTATFNGKANMQDITDPNNSISIGGNLTLQVTMTDRGEPGSSDDIGITVWNNSGGLWYSSNWNGITTVNQLLAGGNLKVTSGSATLSQNFNAPLITNKPEVSKLTVQAHPNPAPNTFLISTKSNNEKTLIINVTDALGRIMETRYGVPANGNFEIGGRYRPGIYFMQVIQGDENVTLKLIKINE